MRQGIPSYQVASWSIQPFGHNRHGLKIGGLCPLFGRELGPHLIECGQRRGLPACQVSSWCIQPFGHNTPPSQTDKADRQTRQRSDSIGGIVFLQTVAQKASTGCVHCHGKPCVNVFRMFFRVKIIKFIKMCTKRIRLFVSTDRLVSR